MAFIQKRKGLNSYSCRHEGIRYALDGWKAAPPGTPQAVIDKARRAGLVVLEPGEAPPAPTEVRIPGQRGPVVLDARDMAALQGRGRLRDRVNAAVAAGAVAPGKSQAEVIADAKVQRQKDAMDKQRSLRKGKKKLSYPPAQSAGVPTAAPAVAQK